MKKKLQLTGLLYSLLPMQPIPLKEIMKW